MTLTAIPTHPHPSHPHTLAAVALCGVCWLVHAPPSLSPPSCLHPVATLSHSHPTLNPTHTQTHTHTHTHIHTLLSFYTLAFRCLPDSVVELCVRLAAQHSMTLTAYCGDRIFCKEIDEHTNRYSYLCVHQSSCYDILQLAGMHFYTPHMHMHAGVDSRPVGTKLHASGVHAWAVLLGRWVLQVNAQQGNRFHTHLTA
jgi:hypothetical protein